MSTFGSFFDATYSWAQHQSGTAQAFMDEWTRLVSAEAWEVARARELTAGLVYVFAEDMAKYYRERLTQISGDALYKRNLIEGHQFLVIIAMISCTDNVTVDVDQINVSLSPSDSLVRLRAVS